MTKPRRLLRFVAVILCTFAVLFALAPQAAAAEDRKVKEQVQPVYPELAKSMGIVGAVRLEVIISAQGTVKSAKVLGGHPVLADAAARAVKNWKYEAGAEETRTVIIEFKK